MEILALHPDEWLAGYLGRIATINNCFTQRQLLERIRSSLGTHDVSPGSEITSFDLIAKELGMELAAFVYDHTLFRLFKAFPTRAALTSNSGRVLTAKQIRFVDQPLRKEVWFCKACVEQDTDTLLFSYWRRSHQIPGTCECSVHNKALSRFAYKGLLNFTPDTCDKVCAFSEETMARIRDQSMISSAITILQRLLEAKSTIGQSEVMEQLRSKSGYEASDRRNALLNSISSDLISNFPAEWLNDYMHLVQHGKTDYSAALKSVLMYFTSFQRSPPAITVTLLAAQYWSVDEAAEILIGAGNALHAD